VGFILFSTGNHKLQPRAEKTENENEIKMKVFKKMKSQNGKNAMKN